MVPEFFDKWNQVLDGIEKTKIPIQFIKKLVVKLTGKRQHTINVQNLFKQGLEPTDIEVVVNKKLHELDEDIVSVEFVLNIEAIADMVQPETDRIFRTK